MAKKDKVTAAKAAFKSYVQQGNKEHSEFRLIATCHGRFEAIIAREDHTLNPDEVKTLNLYYEFGEASRSFINKIYQHLTNNARAFHSAILQPELDRKQNARRARAETMVINLKNNGLIEWAQEQEFSSPEWQLAAEDIDHLAALGLFLGYQNPLCEGSGEVDVVMEEANEGEHAAGGWEMQVEA